MYSTRRLLSHNRFIGLYLYELIKLPVSASSDRPLRSLDRKELIAPRYRTAASQ